MIAKCDKIVFPEIYHVERVWGGPEEGGWWWDRRTPTKTFAPRMYETPEDLAHLRKAVGRLAKFMNWMDGNRPRGSVLSDGEFEGMLAGAPSEFEVQASGGWS